MKRNKKYNIQYERYDFLKKIHICVNCGNEEAEPNSIYCLECKEKVYERNKEYYKKNKTKLNNKNKAYNRQKYYERKNKEICTKCGKRKITKQSETLCIECYIKRKRVKDKRWNNEIPRSERPRYNLCYICGKEKNNDKTICNECFERLRNNMKKLNDNPTEKMKKARKEYSDNMFKFKEGIFKEAIFNKKRKCR